jgi:hypothetical protein
VSTPPRPGILPSVPPPVDGGPRDPAVVHHLLTRSIDFLIQE